MAERESEVLVEEVAQELAHSVVGPAPVHQQQSLEESELSDWVVRRQHGLVTLFSADSHSDVGHCESLRQHLSYVLLKY